MLSGPLHCRLVRCHRQPGLPSTLPAAYRHREEGELQKKQATKATQLNVLAAIIRKEHLLSHLDKTPYMYTDNCIKHYYIALR